jgi:hypothetical protein
MVFRKSKCSKAKVDEGVSVSDAMVQAVQYYLSSFPPNVTLLSLSGFPCSCHSNVGNKCDTAILKHTVLRNEDVWAMSSENGVHIRMLELLSSLKVLLAVLIICLIVGRQKRNVVVLGV